MELFKSPKTKAIAVSTAESLTADTAPEEFARLAESVGGADDSTLPFEQHTALFLKYRSAH